MPSFCYSCKSVKDAQADINHEDLQEQLWVYSKKIANHGINDDHNGYKDDLNGWNFTTTEIKQIITDPGTC
ncbi:hypothetical protein AB674_18140 [Flavobacterium sp. ABG]|nr:hypothetical protein AB674_18140 [Flavobacterium sp. ABG]